MININIDVPQSDLKAMAETFQRYAAYYRNNIPKAIEKTCVQLIKSLRGSTRRSKKTRKVVRNPNRYNASKRQTNKFLRMHEHIHDYYEQHGGGSKTGKMKAWIPRLKDVRMGHKSSRWAIEIFTQRKGMRYSPVWGAEKKSDAKGAAPFANPKAFNIRRRGLADSSWGWMLGKLGKANLVDQQEINGLANAIKLNESGGAFEYSGILMHNKLGYIRKAMSGASPVQTLIARTINQMRRDMGEIHPKAKGAAGLRAA